MEMTPLHPRYTEIPGTSKKSNNMVEKWKRKIQNDVGTMNKERTGDPRVIRNSLIFVDSDATWDHKRALACATTRDHVWIHGP